MTPSIGPAFGVWLTTKDAAAYIPCKSVDAARRWIARHGIARRGNGSVARADLDRAIRRGRKPMAAASLANLVSRHASQSHASSVPTPGNFVAEGSPSC